MARHETEALWAFASGELEAEAQARVADHVAGCEVCATKLEQVRQSQALLSTAREEVPQVRWAQVDERLQSAAARKLARLERRPRWPWALVATGALAAVLAFVVLRPSAPEGPSETPVAVHTPPTPEAPRQEPPVPMVARQEPPAPVAPAVREEPAPVAAPAIATRVESATGAWIRDSKARERLLQPGTQLQAGASVRTRAKSNALLQLPDASRVRLSPNSEVTLASTAAEDVQITVKRGRLAVRASHAARKGFIVEAAGVRASVVGTVFSVERTARGAVVAVLEGKVQVESKGQLPRLVTAGQRVEVIAGKRTPSARALSAQDRQAFQDLGPAPAPAPRPVSGGSTSVTREPRPGLATAAAPSEPTPNAPAATEPPAPASSAPEKSPDPVASAPTEVEESGSEFAPYPVPRPEPSGTVVAAPAPTAPEANQGFVPQSPWEPPEAGAEQPGSTDARFLWSAREQLSATTCESFLVGLAEIAERSTVREFREQARYLRARCFEERLAPAEARAEYERYLREFPRGRYSREAKAALLP
jgi:hypothetical protein